MIEHTQGPLHIGGDGTIIYDKDGWGVANATVFHGRQEPGTAAANARRIVACVNALQHVSTEQLETGELLSVSQRMVDAERQRDALLAALEIARDTLDNVQGDINPERGYADELEDDVSVALGTARAAIAAAKPRLVRTGLGDAHGPDITLPDGTGFDIAAAKGGAV